MGRPIGIWRQKPGTGGGERPCAKPYQGFGYHNTGFRGEGADDTRGILDCPAVRWRDTDGDGEFDEKLSYLQDFRGDIQALVHEKYGVMERVRYGPTGYPESFPASDINFDGIVDETDLQNMQDAVEEFGKHENHYDPRADLNRDGKIDGDDEGLFNDSYSIYSKYEGMWKLSSGPGLLYNINGDNAGLDNRFGWRGYWYDPHLQQYHVRNRVYDPRPGAWKQNDPLGFGAGDQNLYRYADGNYSTGYDPEGLDEPDGTHGAPYRIYPNQEGVTTLRQMMQRSGTVYGIIYRTNGTQTHIIVNNNLGRIEIRSTDDVEDLQQVRAAEATNMNGPARQMEIAAHVVAIAGEITLRTAVAPVDFVWSVHDVIENPKDLVNWVGLIPAVGKLVVAIKDAKGVTKVISVTAEEAQQLAKNEAKLVKEGDRFIVKVEGKAAEACGDAAKAGSRLAKTFEEFKIGRTFGTEREAQKAWEVYQKAAESKGLLIGHGDAPVQAATDGWYALRTTERNWTQAVNDAWIDGAVDAGRPVRLVTPFDEVRRVNASGDLTVTWREIQRVVSRGGQLVAP